MYELTLRTPFKILPPATPPFSSSTSQPGLFTSKDLITEMKATKNINHSCQIDTDVLKFCSDIFCLTLCFGMRKLAFYLNIREIYNEDYFWNMALV